MKQIFELKEKPGCIKQPCDIFTQVKKINIDFKQENFILICLDTKNKPVHTEILFKGGLNCCTVDIRTIYRIALEHNSRSIVIAHNHPSNDLTPSQEDIDVYDDISKAGNIIGITCLDSVVFNPTKYYSMK